MTRDAVAAEALRRMLTAAGRDRARADAILDMPYLDPDGDLARMARRVVRMADQADAALADNEPASTLDHEALALALVASGLMGRYAEYANRVPTMIHGTPEALAKEWAPLVAREYDARVEAEQPPRDALSELLRAIADGRVVAAQHPWERGTYVVRLIPEGERT